MTRWTFRASMADAPQRLQAQQRALTRHLRDPAGCDPPAGWDGRRLAVYRDLVFNTLDGLLASGFPVVRTVLGEDGWRALVRDFQREHACTTPLFPQLGRELIAWLDTTEQLPRPFLPELAHYEWVELALQISDASEVAFEALDAHADVATALLDGRPALSTMAWPLAYIWPVHRIHAGHQPTIAPTTPTLLLVRRDAAGAIHFSELTPLAWRLLERIADQAALTGRQQLEALALEAGQGVIDAFVADASPLLVQLHETGVLPGLTRA